MTTTAALVVALVLVVGAAAQRVTGLGFAVVAAPVLVLLVGPSPSVVLVNVLGAIVALLVLLRVRRDVEPRRLLPVTLAALVGVPGGLVLARSVPSAWLELVLGLLVLAALGVSAHLARARARCDHSRAEPASPEDEALVPDGDGGEELAPAAPPPSAVRAVAAGAGSGVLHAAAGLGSPVLSVHAVASGWPQRSFTASVQPWFVVVGLVAAALEVRLEPDALLPLPWTLWAGAVVAAAVGVVAGELLVRRLPASAARTGLLVLSVLGAASITLEGLVGVLGG
ncbi:TSUP family transporter [uncultured Pseudokineococcus sp.]|uniref:TSUP family transporter n=1 Tax=uncultured Pseudokineococcus sp. TaxID=1642928 RepID=UPI00260AC026|nr:TSUP family transporter [uncultured Pseudokineococcus sp.]